MDGLAGWEDLLGRMANNKYGLFKMENDALVICDVFDSVFFSI